MTRHADSANLQLLKQLLKPEAGSFTPAMVTNVSFKSTCKDPNSKIIRLVVVSLLLANLDFLCKQNLFALCYSLSYVKKANLDCLFKHSLFASCFLLCYNVEKVEK